MSTRRGKSVVKGQRLWFWTNYTCLKPFYSQTECHQDWSSSFEMQSQHTPTQSERDRECHKISRSAVGHFLILILILWLMWTGYAFNTYNKYNSCFLLHPCLLLLAFQVIKHVFFCFVSAQVNFVTILTLDLQERINKS